MKNIKKTTFFVFWLAFAFIGNCLVCSYELSQNLYKIEFEIDNPMRHLSDNVKIGDITQILSHDSLCLSGKMKGRTKNSKFFSVATLANITMTTNFFAACQTLNLKDQLELGVTCFDVRVARPKNGKNDYLWKPHHNGITANLDVLDELKSLCLYSKDHPDSVYMIKLRVENNNFDQFLEDFDEKIEKECSKDLSQFIFTPNDADYKDIVDLTLGDIRKIKKNVIIMVESKNNNVNTNLVFNGQMANGYKWSQTLKYSNKSLVNFVIKVLKNIRKNGNNKFMYASPAHTLGIGVLYGAAYLKPLNDAKNNSEEIVDLMTNKLFEEKIKLQALGLNGIGMDEKLLHDIIDYSNTCIYAEYGVDGFKN